MKRELIPLTEAELYLIAHAWQSHDRDLCIFMDTLARGTEEDRMIVGEMFVDDVADSLGLHPDSMEFIGQIRPLQLLGKLRDAHPEQIGQIAQAIIRFWKGIGQGRELPDYYGVDDAGQQKR